jgi:hypothetical protein
MEIQSQAHPRSSGAPFVKEMLSVNSSGEHDGRATHDAERKSRTARADKEDGDQVWTPGLDGEGDEDVRNNVLAALQRTAWRAAGGDRTPPYRGRLAKHDKRREQDVRVGPNGPRRREDCPWPSKTSAQIITPASAPRGSCVLRRPDEETLAFWRATADDPHEVASRIARFSRALGEESTRNAVQSSGFRLRNAAIGVESRRSDPRGRVLVLPMHSDLGSGSFRKTFKRTQITERGGMKAPGTPAKKTGKTLARGRALQVMVYPRPKTKAALVQASREVNRPLSSFMIMASLKAAAALQGCKVADLIPQTELCPYLREK